MARSLTVLFVVIKLLRRDHRLLDPADAGWNLFVLNTATPNSYQLFILNTLDSDITQQQNVDFIIIIRAKT